MECTHCTTSVTLAPASGQSHEDIPQPDMEGPSLNEQYPRKCPPAFRPLCNVYLPHCRVYILLEWMWVFLLYSLPGRQKLITKGGFRLPVY